VSDDKVEGTVESSRVAFFDMGMGILCVEMYEWRWCVLDEMLLRCTKSEGKEVTRGGTSN
jgi:hypothetical protein